MAFLDAEPSIVVVAGLVAGDTARGTPVGVGGAVLLELARELAASDAVQRQLCRRGTGHRQQAC